MSKRAWFLEVTDNSFQIKFSNLTDKEYEAIKNSPFGHPSVCFDIAYKSGKKCPEISNTDRTNIAFIVVRTRRLAKSLGLDISETPIHLYNHVKVVTVVYTVGLFEARLDKKNQNISVRTSNDFFYTEEQFSHIFSYFDFLKSIGWFDA